MIKRNKSIALILSILLAFSLLGGCGGTGNISQSEPLSGMGGDDTAVPAMARIQASDVPTSDVTTPDAPRQATGQLVIATENDPPSLTVAQHNAVAGTYMNKMTHNGLFRTNPYDFSATPDLVESYENLNDLEWAFTIRKGILFHNGEEMTSADLKASLEYVQQFPDCAASFASIQQVDIINDYTIKITTPEPSAMLLTELAHHGNWIMPKSLIDSGNDFNANPVGAGPYVFKEWTLGDSISFEAFPDYFDKDRSPQIKDITWRVIPEGSSRTIALETGEVDFLAEVATQDIPRMEADPNITVFMTPGAFHNHMLINNEIAPFDNEVVRKALDMAIDKEAVVEVALDGLAAPIYNQTPYGFVGTSNENTNSYNPEGALALLVDAGIDPATLGFELICSNDQKRRCGEVIQSNLAQIGWPVSLVGIDLATYLSVTTDGDYEAALGGFGSASVLAYVVGVFHSSSITASNRSRFSNAEVDSLVDTAKATLDDEKRTELLLECSALLNAHTPQIPLYQDTVKKAYSSKLAVPEIGPSGDHPIHLMYWLD